MNAFKWTVQVEIDSRYVAGGFDLTEDKLCKAILKLLPGKPKDYDADTVQVAFLDQPDPAVVAKLRQSIEPAYDR